MNKEKVILFGAGKLYANRRNLIEGKNDVLCILDNRESKEGNSQLRTFLPEELINLPTAPIIIMSDYFVQMVLQVSKIIGEEECGKRIRIGRVCYPVSEEEKKLECETLQIVVEADKVYCALDDGKRVLLEDKQYIKNIWRAVSRKRDRLLDALLSIKTVPIDAYFGRKRGEPVDRYYIEKFLDERKQFIRGKCLEIAEDTYTRRFGEQRVTDAMMLHVEGWGENVVKGNLETGEGITEAAFDTMIITQTLMFIYDVESAVKHIFLGLAEGGSALITVSGISQIARYDDDNWGMFHSFYLSGLKRIFYPAFGEENVEIVHYGNVKTAMAFLYGAAREELSDADFDVKDADYPVIYGIHARKL